MSFAITARNVNDALASGIQNLLLCGEESTSRNGDVICMPTPTIITYERPMERVLFSPLRNANPFFHLMEALWMLAGRNDLAFPKQFNSRFGEYSDDGVTLHGAYGFRWRNHFGVDQLEYIVRELREHPDSRRAVLQMWDPQADLERLRAGGRDVPCNTVIYFDLRGGVLNMMASNRSNDALWGAFGANAVHFSVLQEYLAARIGVHVGLYHQVTNNLHVYTGVYSKERLKAIAADAEATNHYCDRLQPVPMVTHPDAFYDDLEMFLANPGHHNVNIKNEWFLHTAVPVYTSWRHRDFNDLKQIEAPDWQRACTEWVCRRLGGKVSK